jgi:hypothetical protein
MKLYTEEEVRKAIELARLIQEKGSVEDSFDVESISGLSEICTYGWSERYSTDEISEQLTPIELPSDEEIEEYVDSAGYWGGWSPQYFEGIIEGAKWMRDKIGGNNEP